MSREIERLIVHLDATSAGLIREMRKADKAVDRSSRFIGRRTRKMERDFQRLGQAVKAYLGVQLAKQITNTGLAFDKIAIQLKAATGSAQLGAREFAFLQRETNRLGLSLTGSADAYAKLLAAARGTNLEGQKTRDIFTAVAEAGSVMQFSSENMTGAIRALEQMISKGTVSSEELKLQLGDRLPGAMKIAAQAMGVTTAEFLDMLKKGEVLSDEFLPKFAQSLRENFADGLDDAVTSARASFQRLENEFAVLSNIFAQSGWNEGLANASDNLTEFLENPAVRNAANQWGEALGFMVDQLAEKSLAALTIIVEAIDAVDQAMKDAVNGIAALSIGFQNLVGIIDDDVADMALLDLSKHARSSADTVKKLEKATTNASKEGIKPFAGATDAAAKATENLTKALNDIEQQAMYEQITLGINDVEKAVYDVDHQVGKLTAKYGKLTTAQEVQVEQIKDLIRANAENKEQMEKAQKAAKEYAQAMARPFETAMENIQNLVTDTFEGLFDGSIDSASDAADAIKKIFFRMAAETATLQLLGPQGLKGLLSGAASVTGNFVSAGFGVSDILQQGTSFLGKTAVGTAVDSFGAAALPAIFGTGAPAGAVVGPTLPGVLGSAGIGLSSIALPVAGLAVGALVSSLFKKKPSSKLQSGQVDLSTGEILGRGGLTGKKFSQDNFDKVTALSQTATTLAQILGAEGNLSIAAGNRDGLAFSFGHDAHGIAGYPTAEEGLHTDFQTPNAFFDALIDEMLLKTEELNESVNTALANIDFGEGEKALEQALSDIEFAAAFDMLGEQTEVLSEVELAIQAVNDNFEEMAETADRLGLSVEKATKAQEKALQDIADGFNASVTNSLLQKTNPSALALSAEIARYQQQLADAMALGADVRLVEKLHAENMAAISAQVDNAHIDALNEQLSLAESVSGTLSNLQSTYQRLLDQLAFGNLSGLSPLDQLATTRAQIEALVPKAQLGDLGAQAELAGLIPAFTELSGEVNGFNAEFAKDLAYSREITEKTKGVIDRQLTIQQQIAQSAADEITVMQQGFADMVTALSGRGSSSGRAATNAAGVSLSKVAITGLGKNNLTVGQVEAIGRSLTGHTGSTGNGELSAIIASKGLQSQFDALIKKAAGVPGYATGGLITGGVAGKDSVPIIAMPDEFMLRASAVRSIGVDNLNHMNSTGQLPGNDNGKLLQEVRGLRSDIQQFSHMMASSGEMNASGQKAMVRRLDQLVGEGGLAQWG